MNDYTIKEYTNDWLVTTKNGKLTTEIRIPKSMCPTLQDLQTYLEQESIFWEVIMKNEKRKTTTSSAVKNRYNKKVYDSIIVRVPKEMAQAFKEKCAAEGISQAQIIKEAIRVFLETDWPHQEVIMEPIKVGQFLKWVLIELGILVAIGVIASLVVFR